MSTTNEAITQLRTIELFSDASDELLSDLSEISEEVSYPARATIFTEYSLAENVYFVIEGEVSLVICQPNQGCRQLNHARDGELVGWAPLLKNDRYSAAAHAVTAVKAIKVDGQKLSELCEKYPAFGFHVLRSVGEVVSGRLRAMRLKLLDQCGVHLPEVILESD